MSYSPSPPRTHQIDVVDQVARAYRVVLDHAQLVGEMAFLPFLIVLAAEVVSFLISGAGFFGRALPALINAAGVGVFGIIFAVRWHRYVLLGESVSSGLIPPGWAPFFIAGLKLGGLVLAGWVLLLIVVVLPLSLLAAPLVALGAVALTLLSIRLSMIFPAAAIERPIGLWTASEWITGNFWRLFACALACYLPFVVVQLVINWIAAIFPSLIWIVFEALRLVVSFVGAAVVAALLSHIYREIAPIPAAEAA
jgi:hypothetical protein